MRMKDENSFEIGSVVTLRSGGPALTVKSISGETVECLWYAEEEETFKEIVLPVAVLETAEAMDDEEEDEDDEDGDDKEKISGSDDEDDDEDEDEPAHKAA